MLQVVVVDDGRSAVRIRNSERGLETWVRDERGAGRSLDA